MRRYIALLLSALLLMTSAPLVSADNIYNDDHFDWGEYACPHTRTEEVAEIPSTCTEQGRGGYTRCADCKLLLSGSRDPLPLKDHSYDNACDADCNVCGAVREEGGHDYRVETVAPTCTANGSKTYTCVRCGDSYTETVSATGHTSVVVKGTAATCEQDGLTDGAKCSVCNTILTAQQVIPAIGHSYQLTADVAPTCTANGQKTYTCAHCGDSYTETVSATGHTSVVVTGTAATCEQDGLTDGAKCSVCNAILIAQQVIPAIGHSYQLTAEEFATCVDSGKKTYTCRHCGDSYAETVPATGEHVYDDAFDADCNVCGAARDALVWGDADGNGKVNNRDQGLLLRYLNAWSVTISEQAMDLNGDGKVNNQDLGLLQRLLNE